MTHRLLREWNLSSLATANCCVESTREGKDLPACSFVRRRTAVSVATHFILRNIAGCAGEGSTAPSREDRASLAILVASSVHDCCFEVHLGENQSDRREE